LAAILKQAFKDELDGDRYAEFAEEKEMPRAEGRPRSGDRPASTAKGMMRIFIAKGKLDGMAARDIVEFLRQETGLDGRHIDQVRVFDAFTFATIPSDEAETLIALHKKAAKGNKPLVTMAREREDEFDRGDGGGERGGRGGYGAKRKSYGDSDRQFGKGFNKGFKRY
jgi:ATP-dependent RNA helicase DeaD